MRRDERSPSRRQLVGEIMSALIGSGHGGDSTGLLVVVVRVLVQFLQWPDSTHTPLNAATPRHAGSVDYFREICRRHGARRNVGGSEFRSNLGESLGVGVTIWSSTSRNS